MEDLYLPSVLEILTLTHLIIFSFKFSLIWLSGNSFRHLWHFPFPFFITINLPVEFSTCLSLCDVLVNSSVLFSSLLSCSLAVFNLYSYPSIEFLLSRFWMTLSPMLFFTQLSCSFFIVLFLLWLLFVLLFFHNSNIFVMTSSYQYFGLFSADSVS